MKTRDVIREQSLAYSRASVTFEKVVTINGKEYKLLRVENVAMRYNLPPEYISKSPCFYREFRGQDQFGSPAVLHVEKDGKVSSYKIGTILSENEFNSLMKTLKSGGKRLTEIVRDINEKTCNHHGTFTAFI